MKVAFIGLGVMGFPMAGHLAKAGHEVCVYNRTAAKAQQWLAEYPGRCADTPAQAAQGCEAVFVCVGNDDDVREVVLGEQGAFSAMTASAVLVDHTTASAELARELAGLANAQGLGFLDAPVSGGQAGAEEGVLTVMVGGEQECFDRVAPVMDAYARFSKLLGPAGSGQLAKMVNQICIAGIVEGLAEGLNFASKAGLDGEAAARLWAAASSSMRCFTGFENFFRAASRALPISSRAVLPICSSLTKSCLPVPVSWR